MGFGILGSVCRVEASENQSLGRKHWGLGV